MERDEGQADANPATGPGHSEPDDERQDVQNPAECLHDLVETASTCAGRFRDGNQAPPAFSFEAR